MKLVYGTGLVLLLVLAFLAGHWYTANNPAEVTSPGRRILYYVDPMNPAHTSDKPGIAPCGMKMEPVYADDSSPGQTTAGTSASMAPGTIKITPDKQQLIGIRTGIAEKAAMDHTIRTVGRITADEKRVYRLVAGVDGWIRDTFNNDTGTLVKKDQRLASFYSPQLRAAQISYLSLLGSQDDRSYAGGRQALAPSRQPSRSLQTATDALESLGMSEQQIKEIGDTRQMADRIYIVAPTTGFIISRNVSPSQRFDKGAEWYRIADLSRVWVLADLFRNDAQYVKPGTKVKVTLPQGKKGYNAVVSTVQPQFDAASRTLKVRLEMDNPGYMFKPDMFVDVEFPVRLPPALTVPSDAVIDSGTRKTVFVDRGNGFFEPRRVETGWRLGDRVEITRGLMPGEQIVISGNFLIDSDSRMKMAAAGMYARKDGQPVRDPVCGMELDPKSSKGAGLFLEHGGSTYYFCMTQCKQQFSENPGSFLGKSGDTGFAGPKERAQGSKSEARRTPAPHKMPEQDHSMHGHSMEPREKPIPKKPMDMPEPDRAPQQGMAPRPEPDRAPQQGMPPSPESDRAPQQGMAPHPDPDRAPHQGMAPHD